LSRILQGGYEPQTVPLRPEGGKRINEIAVRELVLAYDEATGTTGAYTVMSVSVHLDETVVHVTLDGERIETTREHPFYTGERGWVYAGSYGVERLYPHVWGIVMGVPCTGQT